MTESQSLIESLPIELWNIILEFTPHTKAKDFILIVTLYKIFTPDELDELKQKYIYDYLIGSSPLNKMIYTVYNNLNNIDTKKKYIRNYCNIFQMMSTLHSKYIVNSLILKNYLLNKIANEKDKVKFEHITKRIYNDLCLVNNTNYAKMLKHL